MSTKAKYFIILVLVLTLGTGLTACDMSSDSTEVPEAGGVEQVSMLVEEAGTLKSLGFNYRNDNVTFKVHGVEEGILKFKTESRLVFPEEVKFEGGEVTVENLQTALDQDKLMVSVKGLDYIAVMELVDPDGESEKAGDVRNIRDKGDVRAVRAKRDLDNVVFYGYMVNSIDLTDGKYPNINDPEYNEWKYFSAEHIENKIDDPAPGFGEVLKWEDAFLAHLNKYGEQSYYVDDFYGYADWSTLLEIDREAADLPGIDEFFADIGISEYMVARTQKVVEIDDVNPYFQVELVEFDGEVGIRRKAGQALGAIKARVKNRGEAQGVQDISFTIDKDAMAVDSDINITQSDVILDPAESIEITFDDYGDVTVTADTYQNAISVVSENDIVTLDIIVEPADAHELSVANQPENQPIKATAGEDGTIEVKVRDEFGNGVEGVEVSVSDDYGLGGLTDSDSKTTDKNGGASFTFNEESAGDYIPEFEAKANENGIIDTATAEVTVEAANIDSAESYVDAADEFQLDGTAEISIAARDEFGNPVMNLDSNDFETKFSEMEEEAYESFDVKAEIEFDRYDDGNDYYVYTFNYHDGTHRFDFRAEGVEIDTKVKVLICGNDPEEGESEVERTSDLTVPAGENNVVLDIEVRDEGGNPIKRDSAGNYINIKVLDLENEEGNTFNETVLLDDGDATIELTAVNAGYYENISVKADDIKIGEFDVEIVAANADSVEVTPDNETTTVSDNFTEKNIEYTVTIKDQFGNAVGNADVNITDDGDDIDVEGDVTQVTDNEGEVIFTVSSETAQEGVTFTFIEQESGDETEATATGSFKAADADSVVVKTHPQESVAGENIVGPPAVYVRDKFGNNVQGISVVVTEDDGQTIEGDTSVTTDNDGKAKFENIQIEKAGSYKLVFDTNIVEVDTTSDVFDVLPADESSVRVEHLVDHNDDQTAGIKFNIENYISDLKDEFGNIVQDGYYRVEVVSGGISEPVFGPADIEFVDGAPNASIDIKLEDAARHTLTVFVGAAQDKAWVLVEPAGVSPLESSGTATSIGDYKKHMTASVYDEYGNPISGLGMDNIKVTSHRHNQTYTLNVWDGTSVYTVLYLIENPAGEYTWRMEAKYYIDYPEGWSIEVECPVEGNYVRIGKGTPWKFEE